MSRDVKQEWKKGVKEMTARWLMSSGGRKVRKRNQSSTENSADHRKNGKNTVGGKGDSEISVVCGRGMKSSNLISEQ